jgi:hypothetical protein
MTLILSGTDGLSDIDGSAATPAIRGTDTNTGIFFPAADTIAFSEGGTESMRIDSSGNVGIGTSSPEVKLDVAGDILINNNSYLYGENSIGGNSKLIGRASDDTLYVGDSAYNNPTIIQAGNNYIGFVANGSERARIDSSGNLLVGTTSQPVSTYRQVIQYSSNGGQGGIMFNDTDGGTTLEACYFRKDGGQRGYIRVTTSGTTYATVSDYRLKTDVAPMIGALAKVMALNPCTYTWKETNKNGQGFIAHELAEVVPDCVTGEKDATRMEQYEISPAVPATYDDDGNELTPAVAAVMGEREVPVYQGIDTSFLVATLTAAIQELKAINDAQAQTIQSLTARIEALEGK